MRFDTSTGGWANDQVSIQQTELCERSDGQAEGKGKEEGKGKGKEEGEGIPLTEPQEHLASFYQVSLVHCRVPQEKIKRPIRWGDDGFIPSILPRALVLFQQ